MLTAGVPVFRLPRELVRHEIQAILSLGVELKCNMRLGRDFTIASLRAEGLRGHLPRHRAAQGAQACRCPAPTPKASIDGMDFLRAFNAGDAAAAGQAHRRDRRRQRGVRRGALGPASRDPQRASSDGMGAASRWPTTSPGRAAPERRQGSPRRLPGEPRRRCPPTRSRSTRAARKASTCTTGAARASSSWRTAR